MITVCLNNCDHHECRAAIAQQYTVNTRSMETSQTTRPRAADLSVSHLSLCQPAGDLKRPRSLSQPSESAIIQLEFDFTRVKVKNRANPKQRVEHIRCKSGDSLRSGVKK